MKKVIIAGLAVIALAGCTNSSVYSGDVYRGNQAKTVQSVSYGTIMSVRPVTIQAEDSPVGAISGAVLGGVAGNAVGGGHGRDIATAIGAIFGGIAGNKVEQQVNKVNAVELEIKTDSGQSIAVVQKQDVSVFAPGQRVRMTGGGRSINVSPL